MQERTGIDKRPTYRIGSVSVSTYTDKWCGNEKPGAEGSNE